MKALSKSRRDKYEGYFAKAFSFIELQVTMVILAISLLNFAGLYRVYSLQTAYIEKNTQPVTTYYLTSPTNSWMRQLGIPAYIEQSAGVTPWTPTITGSATYKIRLNSYTKDFENKQAAVEVTLENR